MEEGHRAIGLEEGYRSSTLEEGYRAIRSSTWESRRESGVPSNRIKYLWRKDTEQ